MPIKLQKYQQAFEPGQRHTLLIGEVNSAIFIKTKMEKV